MTDPTTGVAARLNSLTGLRFFAAAMIVACHSVFVTDYSGLARFSMGVSFFFVLSGFVLAWSWNGGRARDFYRNRFARIYPVYLIALAIGFVVNAAEHVRSGWGPVLATVGLVQAWAPRAAYYFGPNPVSWSLSCETFFYALFPLLIVGLLRCSPTQRRVLMLACLAFAIAFKAVFSGTTNGVWLTDILPLTRLPEFIAGMVLAREMKAGWRCPTWLGFAGASGLVVLFPWIPAPAAVVFGSVVCFVIIIAWGASADLEHLRSPLRGRTMVLLGGASYCLYLLHYQAYSITINLIHHGGWSIAGKVFAISAVGIGAVGAAAVLHLTVEKPVERALRRLGHTELERPDQATRASAPAAIPSRVPPVASHAPRQPDVPPLTVR